MPLLKKVSGEAWGTLDGQIVTAANSGTVPVNPIVVPGLVTGNPSSFAAISSGFTYRAATKTELPPGCTSSGYIETAFNNTPPGADPLTIQLNTTGKALSAASGDDSEYWLDCWIRAVYDGVTALAADSDFYWLAGGGTYSYCKFYLNAANSPQFNPPGFAITCGNSASETVTQPIVAGSSTGVVNVMFGDWNRITIHLVYGAPGVAEFFINGEYHCSVALHADAITWSSQTNLLRFPKWNGIKWQIAGPVQSWNGSDFPLRPHFELDDKPQNLVTKVFKPFGVVADTAETQGRHFVTAETAGTGSTCTAISFGTSGITPYRTRLVFDGDNTHSAARTATTVDQVGVLPYNDEGWASIVLSDASVPSDCSLGIDIFAADDSTGVFKFAANTSSLFGRVHAGPDIAVAPWNHAERYCLCLHLNKDGRASFTLIDISIDVQTDADATPDFRRRKVIWSGPLTRWRAQPLGKIRLTASLAASASTVETGYIAICRRPTFAALDSLSSATYAGVTPKMRVSTCIARSLPYGQENQSIVGGWYPQKENGMPKRLVICPIGTSGITRRYWQQTAFTGMEHTHGIELLAIDAGSINDIAQIDANDATTVLDEIVDNIDSMISQCNGNDNAVWLCTMLNRDYGGGYTAEEMAAIDALNVRLRNKLASWQTRGLLAFSDLRADQLANPSLYPADTTFWADGTHPKNSSSTDPRGSYNAATRMHQIRTVPNGSVLANRWGGAY
jgi:hypothetical protein